VLGTIGQRKPEQTLVSGQRFVAKQALDCFTSAQMEPTLAEAGAQRYVVYGVVTEYCVRLAAQGLLERGGRVEVVTDAILHLDPKARQATFDDIAARGGVMVTASAICAS
jgi:nicotinamidase/pyrazinamidase